LPRPYMFKDRLAMRFEAKGIVFLLGGLVLRN